VVEYRERILLIGMLAILSATTGVPDALSEQSTPIRGGVLREIWASCPACLSYFPEMGPSERAVLPATERLMDYDQNRQLAPFLAESVTIAKSHLPWKGRAAAGRGQKIFLKCEILKPEVMIYTASDLVDEKELDVAFKPNGHILINNALTSNEFVRLQKMSP
jgi:hypothetical protein